MLQNAHVFTSFSVNDIEKAKHFYETVLQLEVKESPEGLELHLVGGNRIFIYPKPNHTPATFTILNFLVENIETSVDELATAGIVFEHYDQEYLKTDAKGITRGPVGPKAIAWFKDPAGNFLSVIQEA